MKYIISSHEIVSRFQRSSPNLHGRICRSFEDYRSMVSEQCSVEYGGKIIWNRHCATVVESICFDVEEDMVNFLLRFA